MSSPKKSAFSNFFRNSDGEIIIFQPPNVPLVVWFVCSVVSRLTDVRLIDQILGIFGGLALMVWAVLEITKGVTPFRKVLGVAILVAMIVGYVR